MTAVAEHVPAERTDADPALRVEGLTVPGVLDRVSFSLEEGTVLAIEPMVNAGGPLVRMGDDGWAVYSEDGSLAAHFEFTVAVTPDGPRILTPWHEDE